MTLDQLMTVLIRNQLGDMQLQILTLQAQLQAAQEAKPQTEPEPPKSEG